jgi:hypothetical protein
MMSRRFAHLRAAEQTQYGVWQLFATNWVVMALKSVIAAFHQIRLRQLAVRTPGETTYAVNSPFTVSRKPTVITQFNSDCV